MKSDRVNYGDLKILGELLPLLKVRLRILRRGISGGGRKPFGRTLIINTCIMGDFLSYLPAIRSLAVTHDIEFDMLVSPTVRPLAEMVKGVKNVFVAKSSYNRSTEQDCPITQSIPVKYDSVIVMRIASEAFNLLRHIECENIISSDVTFLRYLLHLLRGSILNRAVKQSREVAFEVLGIALVDGDSSLYDVFSFSDTDYGFIAEIPAMHGDNKKILIHTGSGWSIKLWGNDKWIELLERIHESGNYDFLFVGGSTEEEAAFEQIQSRLAFGLCSLVGKLNLKELFLVMKRSDYFIGVDSGPRNLAHYADLRSVIIMNPASVKNFMPLSNKDVVVERPNRLPANLFNLGKSSNIDLICTEEVFEAFEKLIQNVETAQQNDPAKNPAMR